MPDDVLQMSLQYLKGVGPRKAADLKKAGLHTVEDLLFRFPIRYEDRSRLQPIVGLRPGQMAAVAGDTDYLAAVLKESMRLHPVIPMVVRHLMEPVTIGGIDLPAGANVAASIILAHESEENHREPQRFRPERFMELFGLLRRRRLVHTIESRQIARGQVSCDDFVGEDHEVLDQTVAVQSVAPLDIDRLALGVEEHLGLG